MKQIKHYLIALMLVIIPAIGLHAQNQVVNFRSGTMTVRQAFEAIEPKISNFAEQNLKRRRVNDSRRILSAR